MKSEQAGDGFFFISEHKALEIIAGFTSLADIDEEEFSQNILADLVRRPMEQDQKAA